MWWRRRKPGIADVEAWLTDLAADVDVPIARVTTTDGFVWISTDPQRTLFEVLEKYSS